MNKKIYNILRMLFNKLRLYNLSLFVKYVNSKKFDVDIFTIPGYYNFGNRLQNFALQCFLKDNGYSVANYYKTDSVLTQRKNALYNSSIYKACKRYEHIHIGESACDPKICFLFGSDQIWNYDYFKNDINYNLGVADKFDRNVKVTYAASVGSKIIDEEKLRIYDINLKNFFNVSVRECCTVEEFVKLGYVNTTLEVDPCLLLSANDWDKYIKKYIHYQLPKQSYDVIYCFYNKKEIIDKFCRDKNKIIDILSETLYSNINHFDFINLIRNAEEIITDSFHCLVFTMIFRKKVRIIIKQDGLHTEERLFTLLQYVNINLFQELKNGSIFIDFSLINYEKLFKAINVSKNHLLDNLREIALKTL